MSLCLCPANLLMSRSATYLVNPLSVFDIMGPIMVGPSSSHTAGAQKIGLEVNRLLKGYLRKIEITLYNSFADTGEGHGTNVAVVAGVLGFSTEDEKMKKALDVASELGIKVIFRFGHDDSRHPNSVLIVAYTDKEKVWGFGESLGGGLINFKQVKAGASENVIA